MKLAVNRHNVTNIIWQTDLKNMTSPLIETINVPSEWLKPSIHPAYARLLCAHLRNQNIDMEAVFKGNSLTWEDLLKQRRFVSYVQFRRLSHNAITLTNCPWLGLEISSMIQVSAHGPLGYGALAAPTVREAFILVEKFLGTRISIFDFELIEEGGRAMFHLNEHFDSAELREFIFVMLLGSFLDLLEKTSGSISKGIVVRFPFKAPPWSDLYHTRFPGVSFSFSHPACEIDMPSSLLDAHCLTADEFAYRNAQRECEQLLTKHMESGDLAEKIKNNLFDDISEHGGHYPSQKKMAERYNMSVRTLIRKLKAEQSSYQAILDEVRKELACWYLQNTNLTIELIAEKLGFQDTSNFSRVFRRWLNCTPSEFKDLF